MSRLKATPEWYRTCSTHTAVERKVGVDRERGIIHGFHVAQEGPFRSEGRGEFDYDSLVAIVNLMRAEPAGLKSRFTHPTLSSDGLGKFVGRARNARLEYIGYGRDQTAVVKADLHLSRTAFEGNPNGNLGKYLLDLAEEDPDAMGASLVLKTKEEYRMDTKGRPLRDEAGNELPPLWYPTELHAIDIVDTGDATRAFLSTNGLPDEIVRRGSEVLDQQFRGCSRATVAARCQSWLSKYLDMRYGPKGNFDIAEARLRNSRRKQVSRSRWMRDQGII